MLMPSSSCVILCSRGRGRGRGGSAWYGQAKVATRPTAGFFVLPEKTFGSREHTSYRLPPPPAKGGSSLPMV